MLSFLLSLQFMLFSGHAGEMQKEPPGANKSKQCSEKLVPYTDWAEVKRPVFSVDVDSSQGRIYYFGAEHSSDPNDAQFAAIEKSWNKLKPTVAFYEGPNRPIAATREETIKQVGESGFVRFLAERDGIAAVSLEPSPQDEVNFVLKKFSSEQVALFFVLRETARLRERRKLSESELREAVAQLLERAAKMKILVGPVTSVPELEAAYARYWKNPAQWWQAPSVWFDPLKTSAETGGIFTNEVNQMSSGYRNHHMYTLLTMAALEGKKVFAVVGRNHVAMQAAALRCALN